MASLPWREQLAVRGHAVIAGVPLDPDNASLRVLGAALGRTSASGYHAGQRNAEGDGVNRVEAMDVPQRDPAGGVVLSTSADDFPLHTDDTFAAEPARWVLMHCWRADASGGGASRIAHVDDVVGALSAEHRQRLRVPDFPSPFGPAAVLAGPEERPSIRFNRRDFGSFGERYGPRLGAEQVEALDRLLAVAERCAVRMRLGAGDCLVVDNHRVLHGRDPFDPRSGRLLKRLRVR